MIINAEMQLILNELCSIEGNVFKRITRLPANDLGNQLIKHYYRKEHLLTRQLITKFMSLAGVVWLRKLMTRDASPIASSKTQFASLKDYMNLLAANDGARDMDQLAR